MMRIAFPLAKSVLVVSAFVGFSGCGGSQAPPAESMAAAEHAHEHADEGPHGGHLIELGEDEYHAELTHDDATHVVGVYLLDSAAENAVPIDASSVTINCVASGQPMQFALPAAAQPGDAAGTSSYFELVSEALCDGWDAPNSSARLNVTIGGRPLVGEIGAHEHRHSHE